MVAILDHEEIQNVVFALPLEKEVGPDGFPTFFFQMYWEVIKEDPVKEIHEFFGAKS